MTFVYTNDAGNYFFCYKSRGCKRDRTFNFKARSMNFKGAMKMAVFSVFLIYENHKIQ